MSTPAFKILADGSDITAAIADRLVSLRITDQAGQQSDSLEIVMDDREKRMPSPRQGAWLKVWLGYSEGGRKPAYMGAFAVAEIEYTGGNRSMTIQATAAATAPELLKEGRSQSWRGKTLGAIVQEVAQRNGMTAVVKGPQASIQIPHEDQTNETDQAFLTRLGEKYGATIKPADGKVVMLPRGGEGAAAGTFTVRESEAEPGWRARVKNRGAYGQVTARYLDRQSQTEKVVSAGQAGPLPKFEERGTFRSQQEAEKAAASRLQSLAAGEVTVTLTIGGRPEINAEGMITLVGFRPEVDGTWNAKSVEHRLDGQGYRTAIECGTKGEESDEWSEGSDLPRGRNNGLPATQKAAVVADAAARARGMNTRGGPDGGNNACVYAVNKVLRSAGVTPPWGNSNYVPNARAVLAGGAGTLLSGPETGAIVIFRDNGNPPYPHIGIVQADGNIISNSSSRGAFSWVASPASYTAYYGRTPEYWRLK
jgi:phage protein D